MSFDIINHIDAFKANAKLFLRRLEQEGHETKEAFILLSNSIIEGKELTSSEKEVIGEQFKDVFKTLGLVGIATLPGGTIFLLLSTYFNLNKYLLPSAFKEKK